MHKQLKYRKNQCLWIRDVLRRAFTYLASDAGSISDPRNGHLAVVTAAPTQCTIYAINIPCVKGIARMGGSNHSE